MKTVGIIYNDKDGVFRDVPFKTRHAFVAYRKFSEIAAKNGIKVVVANPIWYGGKRFSLCWNLLEGNIERNVLLDFVFDRCISLNKRHYIFMRKLRKEMKKEISVMNDPFIEDICNDKYLTYNMFKNYCPATYGSIKHISKIKNDTIVVKPRFGSGGKGIKIKRKGSVKRLEKDFLVQEFINTSDGIKGLVRGVHDLRLVVLNGKIMDFYVRVPNKGFISNISLGGNLVRIPKIPEKIKKISKYGDMRFRKFKPRLYSIDFLFDRRQNPWIVELNSHPGLDIYYEIKARGNIKIYERLCKRLIHSINACMDR